MSDDLKDRAHFVVQLFRECDAIQLPHRPTEEVLLGMIDRIEALEAENKLHAESAPIIHFQGVMYARDNMADAIWAEFKDRWEGERKYALRQIVKWLKGDKNGDDT